MTRSCCPVETAMQVGPLWACQQACIPYYFQTTLHERPGIKLSQDGSARSALKRVGLWLQVTGALATVAACPCEAGDVQVVQAV